MNNEQFTVHRSQFTRFKSIKSNKMRLDIKFLSKVPITLFIAIGINILAFGQDINDNYHIYTGNDLGITYSPAETKIRIWAPSASAIILRLYNEGINGNSIHTDSLIKDISGTWTRTLTGDWKNKYYTLQVRIGNKWNNEVPDMYAKAVGVNGNRGMIVNLQQTNPTGWIEDKRPVLKSPDDIIIWEVHTRDFSVNPSSGIKNKGKFLAFTEKGTRSPQGEKTGLDHLIDLGITHVHILPAFDFSSIDETKPEENKFNWGYDPKNFNVPEGSYSTNPYDGNIRIREFKEMIMSLHKSGIRVIMDVVYNHVSSAPNSNFEQIVPGYYFRHNPDGTFSNGSGCGNETASEQPMMRKFMIESVLYWAQEYHIDGFRFDLMGLQDIETMNDIRAELNKIDTTIFMYGEGWTAGDSPLQPEKRAVKANASFLNGVAVFDDDIRDGLQGKWDLKADPGFICGKAGTEESLKFGIVAATYHPQVDCHKVNYSKKPYAVKPASTINYVTCHDNLCLWDRINSTCPGASENEKLMMQKLANAIVLTSQGVAFLQAGEEIVRTKYGVSNSFNSPDSINWIDWTSKSNYASVYSYYRSLIRLRKNHPAFRMPNSEMIRLHLSFLDMQRPLMIGYSISGNANADKWKDILVYFNGSAKDELIELPQGEWRIVANGNEVNETGLTVPGFERPIQKSFMVPAESMLMLVDNKSIQ
jgi:pullulanase